jgi:VanZ family protein
LASNVIRTFLDERRFTPLRRVWYCLGWAIIAGIVWLSITPAPLELQVRQGDKLEHVFAYGVAMFWFAVLYRSRARQAGYCLAWIGLGIALEFLQRHLGYRSFDPGDMAADAAGVLVGWMLARLVLRLLRAG